MTAPTVTADFYAIRIHFDGVLHAHIDREKFLGLSAWTDHLCSYSIEFAMAGGSIVTQYTSRERWEAVLQGLERVL